MTVFMSLQIPFSDDDYKSFIKNLALKAGTAFTAHDEDGEELSTEPAGDFDSTGVPWLESVHAGTKNRTKDGRWKRKSGVNEADRDAAENAWRQQNAAAQGVPATSPAPSVTIQPTTQPVAGVAIGTQAAAPVQIAAQPAAVQQVAAVPGVSIPGITPPQQPQVVADAPVSLDDVSEAFARLGAKTQITDGLVNQIYAAAGVTDPQSLTTNETHRKNVVTTINTTIVQNFGA